MEVLNSLSISQCQEDQVLILYALNNRYLDDIDLGRILKFRKISLHVDKHALILKRRLESGKLLDKLVEDMEANSEEKDTTQLRVPR